MKPPRLCCYCHREMKREPQARYCFDCFASRGCVKARTQVHKAIREGRLAHPKSKLCVDCNARANGYDHRDYGRPLDVEPVCRSCNHRRGPAMAADMRALATHG